AGDGHLDALEPEGRTAHHDEGPLHVPRARPPGVVTLAATAARQRVVANAHATVHVDRLLEAAGVELGGLVSRYGAPPGGVRGAGRLEVQVGGHRYDHPGACPR